MQVHGYRNPDNYSPETVTRVTQMARHEYDGHAETVIKAATTGHPRPRWYVAFGGDYIPAGRDAMANIVDRCMVPRQWRTKPHNLMLGLAGDPLTYHVINTRTGDIA